MVLTRKKHHFAAKNTVLWRCLAAMARSERNFPQVTFTFNKDTHKQAEILSEKARLSKCVSEYFVLTWRETIRCRKEQQGAAFLGRWLYVAS